MSLSVPSIRKLPDVSSNVDDTYIKVVRRVGLHYLLALI